MFDGFTACDVDGPAGKLHTLRGGTGAPLLLLHGHPQTHVMWHRVAPALAKHFTVVMMDLRGYGDSVRPQSDAEHVAYSKRAMAQDAVAVMRHYGFDRFGVLAHDRGARVAHRLALDHPARVDRMMLLDIAPTLAMYENTTQAFATAYWHWFFFFGDRASSGSSVRNRSLNLEENRCGVRSRVAFNLPRLLSGKFKLAGKIRRADISVRLENVK